LRICFKVTGEYQSTDNTARIINKFIKKTNEIYSKIKSERKEIKRKELKAIKEIEMTDKPEGMVEFEKRLKRAIERRKRKWYKFWIKNPKLSGKVDPIKQWPAPQSLKEGSVKKGGINKPPKTPPPPPKGQR